VTGDDKITSLLLRIERSVKMSEGLRADQLDIVLSANLVRLPTLTDSALYVSTRDVANMLNVSPRQVTEYTLAASLPRFSRDKYYLPDVVNWAKVKAIADRLGLKPRDLEGLGYTDFSLGGEFSGSQINDKVLPAILGETKSKASEQRR
jgi:hypothetical protein